MQKNLLLAICCMCCTATISAQLTYKLEVDQQPYVELTGDTLVFQEAWFNSTKKVPVGFTFEYFGKTFDSVTVWNDGLVFDYESITEDSIFYLILACDAYLSDRSIPGPWQTPQSPITYKTEGMPGNRIFKYQVKNAGFSEGTADDYANFQVWLYEQDQSIEFRYGDIYTPSNPWEANLNAPVATLFESIEGEILLVEGDENAPYLTQLDPSGPEPATLGLNNVPIEGRIFRFKLSSVGVSDLTGLPNISLSPNPVSHTATITIPDTYLGTPYSIVSLDGKIITQGLLTSTNLNTNDLKSGVYSLKIKTNNGYSSVKFIKH